jgi:HEAT repeat protein
MRRKLRAHVERLYSANDAECTAAAKALGDLGPALRGRAAADVLAVLLDTEQDRPVRRRLVQILGEWRHERVVGNLQALLAEPDEAVRTAVLDVAAELGEAGQETLVETLRNDSPKVRAYAFSKIERDFRPTPKSTGQLLRMMNDPDAETRDRAFRLLRNPHCAVPDLAPVRLALDDANPSVIACAIEILHRCRDRARLDRIRELAPHPHEGVASAALTVLSECGEVPPLVAALAHCHWRVRERAHGLLRRMTQPEAKAALAEYERETKTAVLIRPGTATIGKPPSLATAAALLEAIRQGRVEPDEKTLDTLMELKKIAGQSFGEDAARWQTWWESSAPRKEKKP